MLLHDLDKKGLINPPKWLPDNTHYLCAMGSVAYGVSGDMSDVDIYGWCFPPKEIVFPHLAGYIHGFGHRPNSFETWQEHHVKDASARKEYDFQIFSIVRYFDLLLDMNPNMADSLFVPDRCVLHQTKIAQLVRENRHQFLHKGSYHRFKGYAYAQLKKLKAKKPSNPERAEVVEKYGMDLKFAYHIVRLALECEQILVEHDLTLDRNAQVLKAIREGEWTLERLEKWFEDKELQLEEAYSKSTLRAYADQDQLKSLLIHCLEEHYGNLSDAVYKKTNLDIIIQDLELVLVKHRGY